MKHEKLLDVINAEIKNNDFACMVMAGAPNWVFYSLKAIVELHKPHENYKDVCSGCYEEESGFSDYPCPTIELITDQMLK